MQTVMPRNSMPPPVAEQVLEQPGKKRRKKAPGSTREGNHRSAFRHRCFHVVSAKGGWRATNFLSHLSHGIPRSFRWNGTEDQGGIRTYIDLITAGRKAEARLFETQGSVFDVVEDPEGLASGSTTCNFAGFLDLIALRGHVDLPLRERVQFLTDGKKLVPAQFITMLAQHVPNSEWFGDAQNWRKATKADLDQITQEQGPIHSGMYRDKPTFLSAASIVATADALSHRVPDEADDELEEELEELPAVSRESEIRRAPYEHHFELVTVVTQGEERPFYARRLARYNGLLLWAGSSYSISGPWTEYHRDNAQLLALGLNP